MGQTASLKPETMVPSMGDGAMWRPQMLQLKEGMGLSSGPWVGTVSRAVQGSVRCVLALGAVCTSCGTVVLN